MGVIYVYANLETVGSSIIAVTTQNRSLLPLISASQGVFLAPSSYGANRAPFSDRRWDRSFSSAFNRLLDIYGL
jgi:hypothetical protein